MWRKNWLGRLDSNQRMAVPKTAALPLGYAPIGPKNALADEDGCIAIPPVRRKPAGALKAASFGARDAGGRPLRQAFGCNRKPCRRMSEKSLPRHRTAAITPRLSSGLANGPASS